MDNSDCFSYRSTGFFSRLICDYLDQKEELKPFYNRFPSLENFKEQIVEKQSFPEHSRQLLADALQGQYAGMKGRMPAEVEENIRLLRSDNTFTVTTGHQLNILTGPLYFIYKIITTINLAKELKANYQGLNFVPVYWMATEDHDFEEINFINFYGGKLRWDNDLKGAVGHMPPFGMGRVLDELEEHLGPGENAAELLEIFRTGYHEHDNLADATRCIVNSLFGDEGLVIIDGDDAKLKRSMISHFKSDLLEHKANEAVAASSKALAEMYFDQVYPREINLFYLKPGLRERIERKGEQWLVLNSDISFTREELMQELEEHPERFSPNVVLRPLYQEVILPNLAYIGGGGEIAYWLQLKDMFAQAGITFPMLFLRNSVLWISQKWQNRMADIGLQTEALFQPLHELQNAFAKRGAPVDPELESYYEKLAGIFDELEEVAKLTEKSMLGAVNAQRAKQLNGLENLRKKLLRAEKRRNATDMEKIERIHQALFPNGGLQERHDNLSPYFAAHGREFIEVLKKALQPLAFEFTVVKE